MENIFPCGLCSTALCQPQVVRKINMVISVASDRFTWGHRLQWWTENKFQILSCLHFQF